MVRLKAGLFIDLGAEYLFFAKSAFPSLFIASNPLVIDGTPSLFEINKLTRKEQPYVFYSVVQNDAGMRDTLVEDLAFYIRMHKIPGVQQDAL